LSLGLGLFAPPARAADIDVPGTERTVEVHGVVSPGTTRSRDGELIGPVDLPPRSPTRLRFSDAVRRCLVSAVPSSWNRTIFSGRDVPPPELSTDEELVKCVLMHGGAIGYVSKDARLGAAKIVTIR
jgi:hypothetical protein